MTRERDRPLEGSLYGSGPGPAGRPEPLGDPAAPLPVRPAPEPSEAPSEAPAAEPTPEAPFPGRRFGRYRLGRVIGAGGMGVVHEAWDEALGRRVALKVLATGAARSAQAFERFRQEATITARLRHPNIVVVHEAGLAEGQAYIAMEFVEGRTLEEEIAARLGEAAHLDGGPEREEARRGALEGLDRAAMRRICALTRDVARALHCGHTWVPPGELEPAPIVHRDVKPANIMVDRHGVPRLLDYGLAKEVGVTLTVTREAVGTPLYMSPEQLFSARRVGPRSDVYSLGMTLYACLTLARPFELSRPDQLFAHLMHDDPTAPRRLNPGIPRELETIVLAATAKDERERYASAEDLADDLEAFLADRPIRARPPSLLRRLTRACRRHAVLSAAGALLLLGLGGWWALEQHRADQALLAAARAEAERQREVAAMQEEARRELTRARLAYELASTAKAADPEGDRWLALLNEGHRAERQALEGLARLGAAPDEPTTRLLALAQGARGDGRAREKLDELAQRVEGELRDWPQLEAVLGWLPARIEEDPQRLWAGLMRLVEGQAGGARTERADLGLLAGRPEELLALRGLLQRLRISLPAGDDPRAALWELHATLVARQRRLSALAGEHEPLARALAELTRKLSLRVTVPAGEGAVSVRALDEAGRPGAVLTAGPTGTELEAAGAVLVTVAGPGSAVRFPLHLPRAVWGTPRTSVELALPCAPGAVPDGMVLVVSEGERPFWLDRDEVSRARYQEFLGAVAASGHATCPPEERQRWPGGKDHTPAPGPAPERLDLPVTGVDWHDARAFASWAGARLPTRAEWLQAAAPDGWAPRVEGANLRGLDDGQLWLGPVGQGPEALCGARALVGNAAEWLASEEEELPFREAAGGGFADASLAGLERGVARYPLHARGADLGFRCARDLPEGDPAPQDAPAGPDPTVWREVPAGRWTLGEPPSGVQGMRSWRPGSLRVVELSAFAIEPAPVSRGRLAAWLRASGREVPPELARDLAEDPEAPALVTWEEAAAFAAWAGKRLPSEAEWEAAFAAREQVGVGLEPGSIARAREWCRDTYHPDFPQLSQGLRDPWNRWTPEGGHALRGVKGQRFSRSGGDGKVRAAFRCAVSSRAASRGEEER